MAVQRKIFYGWWVLAALFVVGSLGPTARYSITAFFPLVSSELEWSRSIIGTAQSLNFWAYSFLAIPTGWMIDRIGSRRTFFLGGLLCVTGWMLLSTTRSLWQLYIYYGLVMAMAVSNTHYVPLQATSRKWFVNRAGLAGGIVGSAYALGSAVFSPLLTLTSSVFGWRIVSVVTALVSGIPVMLLSYFVIRDTPESIGQHPDSASSSSSSQTQELATRQHWDVKDALRAPQFWLLFIAYSLSGVVMNGIMAHLVIWAVDLGSTTAAAGLFVTLFSGPSIVSRIGGGWLGDKYGKKKVMLLGALLPSVMALLGWQGINSPSHLIIFAPIMGLVMGFSVTLFAPYLGDLFGRKNVGSLFGILTLGWGLIGGFGPMVWGVVFDSTGNYSSALLISGVCYAIALVALLLVRPLMAHPQKRTTF